MAGCVNSPDVKDLGASDDEGDLPGLEQFGRGDIELHCPGQGDTPAAVLRVHRQILIWASPVFRTALNTRPQPLLLKVDRGSTNTWLAILKRLYPMHPRPELSIEDSFHMLPVTHQYDLRTVQSEIMALLGLKLPTQLTGTPKSPFYVIHWLHLADNLQLDALRTICMNKLKDMTVSKQLATALLGARQTAEARRQQIGVHQPTGQDWILAPSTCPCGKTSSCPRLRWCKNHQSWMCYTNSPSGSYYVICSTCGDVPASEVVAPIVDRSKRWFQNGRAPLRGSVRQLSRETLEDLLGAMVAICGDG